LIRDAGRDLKSPGGIQNGFIGVFVFVMISIFKPFKVYEGQAMGGHERVLVWLMRYHQLSFALPACLLIMEADTESSTSLKAYPFPLKGPG
jgi:hypothetical protein